jgi:hypothetical protein
MIDYVKIKLSNIDLLRLLKLKFLDFKSEISETTGEISTTKSAKYKHCKITIKENSIDIENPHIYFTGSIHKLWNETHQIYAPNHNINQTNKGFNGNQFNLKDVIEVRTHLENLFDCNASQMTFENIELGANIVLQFSPIIFLSGLLFHKNKKFESKYSENYFSCKHNNFSMKIYNKGSQYEMSEYVLRFELHINRMTEVKGLFFKTFADINRQVLENAKDYLLRRFDEIVYYDNTIDKNKLSESMLYNLKNYSNYNYWINELKPNHRDRPKKELKKIIENYSGNLHKQIRSKIIEKCVIINNINKVAKAQNCVTINRIINKRKKSQCVIINHSFTKLNSTHDNIKKDEVQKAQLSYQEQRKSIAEYNRLAVLNYNSKYNQ